MALAHEFRAHASDCLARAQNATTGADRLHWLEMAQFWTRLAQYVEEMAASGDAQSVPGENGNGHEDTDRSDP